MNLRTLLMVGAFLTLPAWAQSPAYWPTQGWRTATPEEQGFDSGKLAEGLQAMREKNLNLHSLMVVRNGMVVLDAYFYPYDGKTVHELASVTKSLTTTLIAMAADQGRLKLDQPMLSFFPERRIANLDERKGRITVRHLTSMSSGLDCTAANDEQTLGEMQASPDYVQFTLDRKMTSEPGTAFVYCSPGMHLLSAILQKATGMTELAFAQKYLFEPLGIKEVFWDVDSQGYNHGWADVFLHPRDAAKLGYLWMNKGIWEGKQIVPKDWVENSVKVQLKTGENDDYGYGWWITGKDEYAAIGRGGQRIQVWPAINTLLVMTGAGVEYDDIVSLIAPALVDPSKPLPTNPAGVAKLNAAINALAQAPAPKAVAPLPALAQNISDKIILIQPNPFQIKALRLVFDAPAEAGLEMSFSDNRPNLASRIGLDGVYRISPWDNGLPMGQRGSWVDGQTFVLEWDGIANRDAYTLTWRFQGNQVTVMVKERTRSDTVRLVGQIQSP